MSFMDSLSGPKKKIGLVIIFLVIAASITSIAITLVNELGGGSKKKNKQVKGALSTVPGSSRSFGAQAAVSESGSAQTGGAVLFRPLPKNPFHAYAGTTIWRVQKDVVAAIGSVKPDFTVKVIFYDGADSSAVVADANGGDSKKVKVGESFLETKVLEIRKDEIIAQKNGIRFRITSDLYEEMK